MYFCVHNWVHLIADIIHQYRPAPWCTHFLYQISHFLFNWDSFRSGQQYHNWTSGSEVFLVYKFRLLHQGTVMISNFEGAVNLKWNYSNKNKNKNKTKLGSCWHLIACELKDFFTFDRKCWVLINLYHFHRLTQSLIPFSQQPQLLSVWSVLLYNFPPLAVHLLHMIKERPCL